MSASHTLKNVWLAWNGQRLGHKLIIVIDHPKSQRLIEKRKINFPIYKFWQEKTICHVVKSNSRLKRLVSSRNCQYTWWMATIVIIYLLKWLQTVKKKLTEHHSEQNLWEKIDRFIKMVANFSGQTLLKLTEIKKISKLNALTAKQTTSLSHFSKRCW